MLNRGGKKHNNKSGAAPRWCSTVSPFYVGRCSRAAGRREAAGIFSRLEGGSARRGRR